MMHAKSVGAPLCRPLCRPADGPQQPTFAPKLAMLAILFSPRSSTLSPSSEQEGRISLEDACIALEEGRIELLPQAPPPSSLRETTVMAAVVLDAPRCTMSRRTASEVEPSVRSCMLPDDVLRRSQGAKPRWVIVFCSRCPASFIRSR